MNPHSPYQDEDFSQLAHQLQRERSTAYRWLAVGIVIVGAVFIGVAMWRAM